MSYCVIGSDGTEINDQSKWHVCSKCRLSCNTERIEVINNSEPLLLPDCLSTAAIAQHHHHIQKRNELVKVQTYRKLLTDEPEKWMKLEKKSSYHFPGVSRSYAPTAFVC